jgi:hypothetical protein
MPSASLKRPEVGGNLRDSFSMASSLIVNVSVAKLKTSYL